MNILKIGVLSAVMVTVLGFAGPVQRAQAQDTPVTGIEMNVITEMAKVKPKCIKRPKKVPGTGGPMLPPPGTRFCN